jgi:hypothetical protein
MKNLIYITITYLLFITNQHLNAITESNDACTNDQFTIIRCETGEIFKLKEKDRNYVRALTDLHVLYLEDSDGNLTSYDVEKDHTLKRTFIYRTPLIGFFYNLMHENSFTLKTPTKENIQTWAISRTMYDHDTNCTTVSVFELICPYPLIIRNRDPWLYPTHNFLHKGPEGIFGVHITAIDQWVAISGYNRFFQRIIAFKKLNYDLAGHNFMMTYKTSTSAWTPHKLFQFIGKKIGISQTPVSIPLADWTIRRLPPFSKPNILLTKINNEVILCVRIKDGEKPMKFFKIDTFEEQTLTLDIPDHDANWPQGAIFQPELIIKEAKLNGRRGKYTFSSQEPLDGVFTDQESQEKTEVFKIIGSSIDFLTNRYQYVDASKKALDLTFLN